VENGIRFLTRNSTSSPCLTRSVGPGSWPFDRITLRTTPATFRSSHVSLRSKRTALLDTQCARHRMTSRLNPLCKPFISSDLGLTEHHRKTGLLYIGSVGSRILFLTWQIRLPIMRIKDHKNHGQFENIANPNSGSGIRVTAKHSRRGVCNPTRCSSKGTTP
jgi:hypothetical protein